MSDNLIYILMFAPVILASFLFLFKQGWSKMKFPIFTTLIGIFCFYVVIFPVINGFFAVIN